MSKKPENDPAEGKGDENPEETGEKTPKELGIVRHIHELITGKGGETTDNPPANNPADKPPETTGEDGETEGEGSEEEIEDAEQKVADEIKKAEEERKGLLKKIGGLEKRLKTYEKKEQTDMVEEIQGVIADLKQSAEDKKKYAEDLKKAQDELKEVKERLGERETQLGAIAMKKFEEEKTALVEAVRKDLGDDKAKEVEEKITSPEDLEQVKGWMTVFIKAQEEGGEGEGEGEGGEPASPSIHTEGADLSKTGGKASLQQPSKKDVLETARDWINKVYDEYELELFKAETGKKYDPAKMAESARKLNQLWESIGKGIKARGGRILGERGSFDVYTCPYCKSIMIGTTECPSCKKTLPKTELAKMRR